MEVRVRLKIFVTMVGRLQNNKGGGKETLTKTTTATFHYLGDKGISRMG